MIICHLQRGTFHSKIGGSFTVSWKGEIAMKGKSELQNPLITQGLSFRVCTMVKKACSSLLNCLALYVKPPMLKKCSMYKMNFLLVNSPPLEINYLKTSCKKFTRTVVFNIHYMPRCRRDFLNPFSQYNCTFDLQNDYSKEFNMVIMCSLRKNLLVYYTAGKLFEAAHSSHVKIETIWFLNTCTISFQNVADLDLAFPQSYHSGLTVYMEAVTYVW